MPNYFANKHLVWRDKSKDNVATEITVFWLAAVLGTAFAMGFVFVAGRIVPEAQGEAGSRRLRSSSPSSSATASSGSPGTSSWTA